MKIIRAAPEKHQFIIIVGSWARYRFTGVDMSTGLNQQSISGKLYWICWYRAQSVQKVKFRKFWQAKKQKIRASLSRSQSPSKEGEDGTQAAARMQTTWIEYYQKWQERKTNGREHYMVGFFKYLTVMRKNAVEHVCHVHILINIINRDGDDMYFPVKKKRLYKLKCVIKSSKKKRKEKNTGEGKTTQRKEKQDKENKINV